MVRLLLINFHNNFLVNKIKLIGGHEETEKRLNRALEKLNNCKKNATYARNEYLLTIYGKLVLFSCLL